MTPIEMHAALLQRNVRTLYHANSVRTSKAFLQLGGLASRGYIERNQYFQTDQYTDGIDKAFGIWNDVFFDTFDIHARISNKNKYGPVLFSMSVDFLLLLPRGSRALITKKNPTKWVCNEADSERYFLTEAELSAGFSAGTFDQMLVVRTPNHLVPFGKSLVGITVDDATAGLANGASPTIFSSAVPELAQLALSRGVMTPIRSRVCNPWCKCMAGYVVNGVPTPEAIKMFTG